MTALRFLGAALIVAACTGLGLEKAGRLRARTAALTAVLTVLTLLRGEIAERRTPMPEIAERLAREAPEPCRGWFRRLEEDMGRLEDGGFAGVWRRSLEETTSLPLGKAERESLCLLGLSLGRFDAPEQAAAIDRCIRETEEFRRQAAETAQAQGRLFAGLGIAGGLLLAIVLL